jgi:hypothetical protein
VVGGLGLLGAITGTVSAALLTQRRSDRRESLAWEREREREREAWAREDRARTFEHRRKAYADFYEALRAMTLRVYNHGMGLGDLGTEELPEGWQLPAYERLLGLQLYASEPTYLAASEAYSAAWSWGYKTRPPTAARQEDIDVLGDHVDVADGFFEGQIEVDEAADVLLALIRADLNVDPPTAAIESTDESARHLREG